jgi:hypothetical protein
MTAAAVVFAGAASGASIVCLILMNLVQSALRAILQAAVCLRIAHVQAPPAFAGSASERAIVWRRSSRAAAYHCVASNPSNRSRSLTTRQWPPPVSTRLRHCSRRAR